MQRKIIHCDCDCFYAAIEMRDDPALQGRPLAVGGQPQQRGVIATCNYEARAFGVRSAMPSATALKQCPQLVILPPNMEKYRLASQQIAKIYRSYTDLVEPLALDEAFLDVSHSAHHHGSATLIAKEIRVRIFETVGITASAGVAPNKFIAKIASDWNKPNGLFVVCPADVDAFVAALPVKKIFGVGKVTEQKLLRQGIKTCQDLRTLSLVTLKQHFGTLGERLYDLCRGIDHRPVNPERIRKSISVETTYPQDIPHLADCIKQLPLLYQQLQTRIQRAQIKLPIKACLVKLRFNDFQQTTAECAGAPLSLETFSNLLTSAYHRRQRPVRLIGIGVRITEEEKTPLIKEQAESLIYQTYQATLF